jgi:hypothetical protein
MLEENYLEKEVLQNVTKLLILKHKEFMLLKLYQNQLLLKQDQDRKF